MRRVVTARQYLDAQVGELGGNVELARRSRLGHTHLRALRRQDLGRSRAARTQPHDDRSLPIEPAHPEPPRAMKSA